MRFGAGGGSLALSRISMDPPAGSRSSSRRQCALEGTAACRHLVGTAPRAKDHSACVQRRAPVHSAIWLPPCRALLLGSMRPALVSAMPAAAVGAASDTARAKIRIFTAAHRQPRKMFSGFRSRWTSCSGAPTRASRAHDLRSDVDGLSDRRRRPVRQRRAGSCHFKGSMTT